MFNTPSLALRSLVACAFVGITVGIPVFGIHSAAAIRSSELLEQLNEATASSNLSAARQIFEATQERKSLDQYYIRATDGFAHSFVDIGLEVVRIAELAGSARSKLATPALEELAASTPAVMTLATWDAYSAAVTRLAELAVELDALRLEERSIDERVMFNRTQLERTALRLGDLFSLSTEVVEGNSAADLFYSSGPLLGAPRLKRLSADFPDLTTLKEAISRAGGTVELKGSEAPVVFQTTLSDIIGEAAPIREKIALLDQTRQEVRANMTRIITRRTELKTDAASLAAQLLNELQKFYS